MTRQDPQADPVFEGVYGPYTITDDDRREVRSYRLALSAVAVAQLALLGQWRAVGPAAAWPWLVVMAVGLGLALRWIHIYLRPLHRLLQLFWLVGCLGAVVLAARVGPAGLLPALAEQPLWILAVGPLFAAPKPQNPSIELLILMNSIESNFSGDSPSYSSRVISKETPEHSLPADLHLL